MLPLFKKDFFRSFMTHLFLVPLFTIYWLSARDALDFSMILTTGGFMLVFSINAIFSLEMYESKAHGYGFLNSLPLTAAEIVGTRFILVFLNIFIFAVYSAVLFTLFPSGPGIYYFSLTIIVMSAVLAMLIGSITYLLIYSIGFTKYIKTMLFILPILGIVIPIIIIELFYDSITTSNILKFTDTVAPLVLIIIAIAGLIAFYLMMKTAARIYNANKSILEA